MEVTGALMARVCRESNRARRYSVDVPTTRSSVSCKVHFFYLAQGVANKTGRLQSLRMREVVRAK